jgi:hypothetical protein
VGLSVEDPSVAGLSAGAAVVDIVVVNGRVTLGNPVQTVTMLNFLFMSQRVRIGKSII